MQLIFTPMTKNSYGSNWYATRILRAHSCVVNTDLNVLTFHPKQDAAISSYDSEYSLRHVHFPRRKKIVYEK